jgi:hypothetical protein
VAITVVSTSRGTASEKVSDQGLALVPSANFTADNYAILLTVWDAMAAETGATSRLSATDNGPLATWTPLIEWTQGGGALDGVTAAIFLAHLTTALTTAHTISIASNANSTAKAAGVFEVNVGAGNVLELSASGAAATNAAASTSYSVTLSGLTSVPGIYVGFSCAEEELATAVTMDTAFTTLAAGTIGSGTAGVNTSNVIARAGYLQNTSTGDTYNATGLTSADRVTMLVRLEEATLPAGPTFPPHAIMARAIV